MFDNKLLKATDKIRESSKDNRLTISSDAVSLLNEIGDLLQYAKANDLLPAGSIHFQVDEIYHHPEMVEYVVTVANEKRTVHTSKHDSDTMLSLMLLIRQQFPNGSYVHLAPNNTLLYGRLYLLPATC